MKLTRPLRKNFFLAAIFIFSLGGLSSCATYKSKTEPAKRLIQSGQYDEAADQLHQLAESNENDRLAYLLEYATTLQMAKKFKESNQSFLEADKLAEQLDYHSISKVTGSLLLNEEVKQYKGDTFEKIFINAYLAMNFLEMGQFDSALVESRRINEKFLKYRAEDKKNFELNAWALYLSALAWEAQGQYDDASIAYTDYYKLSSASPQIQKDLIRMTKKSKRSDEYKKWKDQFPEVQEDPAWYDKKKAEVILIYQQGWGPQKVFSRYDFRFPELDSVYSNTQAAILKLNDQSYRTEIVYDTEAAARRTLEDDKLSLLGRRLVGIAAKKMAADELRRKDETLGFLAYIFMRFSDRADLRQWSTLPQTIQIAHVFVDPGIYLLSVEGRNSYDQPSGEDRAPEEVTLKPGQKFFLNWRSLK